ncbi:MAG: hypothetical protein ABIQ49_05980 [Gemmatimonadales bacterium]
MRLRYKNGGAPVLDDRLPLTVQRLEAMVGPTPVIYRVEDAHTCEWREATKGERARVRAWLGRFGQQRGDSRRPSRARTECPRSTPRPPDASRRSAGLVEVAPRTRSIVTTIYVQVDGSYPGPPGPALIP